jgi:hypothetical protein
VVLESEVLGHDAAVRDAAAFGYQSGDGTFDRGRQRQYSSCQARSAAPLDGRRSAVRAGDRTSRWVRSWRWCSANT